MDATQVKKQEKGIEGPGRKGMEGPPEIDPALNCGQGHDPRDQEGTHVSAGDGWPQSGGRAS